MDALSDLFRMLQGCLTPARIVPRGSAGGLTVSTVYAHDLEVYETAVCDNVSNYPVERYEDEETALAGHARWVEAAPSLDQVLCLGFGTSVRDKTVVLVR